MNNEDMRKAFEQAFVEADQAFNRMDQAFKKVEKTAEQIDQTPSTGNISINFTNRRWTTFCKFLKCAFEILLRGKTTLFVKKR